MTTSTSDSHEVRPAAHDAEKAKPKRRNNNNNRRNNRKKGGKKEEQNSSAEASNQVEDADPLTENEPKVVEASNSGPDTPLTTQPKKSSAQFSSITFASLADRISKDSLRALKETFGFEFMTKVQEATLEPILAGNDVLARAKTGSGKTVAFLLPTIEVLAKGIKNDSLGVGALVLSPTRELAMQIQNEVTTLTTFHKGMSTVCLIGGTNMKKDVTRLKNRKVNLIVATPGRLLDHLRQGTEDLPTRLQSVQMLVFDEADRLLDMGFRDSIKKILNFLPSNNQERQTLLFSATLPTSLESITKVAMKPDHVFVDTLEEGDKDTNVQVAQSYGVSSIEDQFVYLEHYLRQHIEESKTDAYGYKIMVFFNTARTAGFMSELFTKTMGIPILEMHSRKSQGYRSRVASQFTSGKNLIMFSSDVSARGVDYDNVSLVLQVGLTDRDQYIHRLGRTGRAGRKGKGILILQDFEQSFLKELKDLPIEKLTDTPAHDTAKSTEIMQIIQTSKELTLSAERAYQGYLGFYNSNLRRLKLDKKDCVALANEFGQALGFEEPPFLEAKTVRKMGLQGVGGLRIGGGGRGGQGRGGGRGGGHGRGRGGRGRGGAAK